MTDPRPRCLVYASYSFSGQGVAQSCASIVDHFSSSLRTEVFLARARKPLDPSVIAHESLSPLKRRLPWRLVRDEADAAVEKKFRAALRQADPSMTIVYAWPGTPLQVVREARQRGFAVIREMVNTACATSGPILDAAYDRLQLPRTHLVTADVIAGETEELVEYDYIFAGNPEVEASLARLGVDHDRVIATSFGWDPDRYASSRSADRLTSGVRVLFVGSIGVRKGIPELLDAWQQADIEGELVLVGGVEAAIADLVDKHVVGGRVRLTGYIEDVGSMYLSSDIFVFPTLEEGGPQVTYEAAGCGLPVVTTPMGAARLVIDRETGLVVDAGDTQALLGALRALAGDRSFRARLGANAQAEAQRFDYARVGKHRGQQLARIARRQEPLSDLPASAD